MYEGLADAFIYRYRNVSTVITTDWNRKGAPRHLLTREWLRLTKNAFSDGVLLNEYVTIRQSGPMLTNNLCKVPKNKLDRLTLFQLLQTRVIQCE